MKRSLSAVQGGVKKKMKSEKVGSIMDRAIQKHVKVKELRQQTKEVSKKGILKLDRIPHGFYEKELRKYFSQFGKVLRVMVARSPKTGKSKGFAFVEFQHEDVAEIAAESMNNYLMFEKLIRCRTIPHDREEANKIFKHSHITEKSYPKLRNRQKLIASQSIPLSKEEKMKILDGRIQKLQNMNKSAQKMKIDYKFPIPSSLPISVIKIGLPRPNETKEYELSDSNSKAMTRRSVLNTDLEKQIEKLKPIEKVEKSLLKKSEESKRNVTPTRFKEQLSRRQSGVGSAGHKSVEKSSPKKSLEKIQSEKSIGKSSAKMQIKHVEKITSKQDLEESSSKKSVEHIAPTRRLSKKSSIGPTTPAKKSFKKMSPKQSITPTPKQTVQNSIEKITAEKSSEKITIKKSITPKKTLKNSREKTTAKKSSEKISKIKPITPKQTLKNSMEEMTPKKSITPKETLKNSMEKITPDKSSGGTSPKRSITPKKTMKNSIQKITLKKSISPKEKLKRLSSKASIGKGIGERSLKKKSISPKQQTLSTDSMKKTLRKSSEIISPTEFVEKVAESKKPGKLSSEQSISKKSAKTERNKTPKKSPGISPVARRTRSRLSLKQ